MGLKPLEPSPTAKADFVVCDIENTPDGNAFSIDFAWRKKTSREIEHKMFESWDTAIDWLFARARTDKRFRSVYAHNGGGWDWLSLAQYLLREGKRKRQVITAATAASRMVTMTVKIESQFSIHFCDSLQLLRSSLDSLAKKFVGRGKVDIGDKLPHELDHADMVRYQQQDTELLLIVLERALDMLRDKVAQIDTFGHTIGSTALKVFKTIGMSEPISIPWNPVEKEFFRRGYTGGRVEVFQYGYFGSVNVYDVNSLYPYAMLTTDVPISEHTIPGVDFDASTVGVFHVTFRQKKTDAIPVLTFKGHGIYSGEGVYFTPELNLLREVDPTAEIIVHSGYRFVDTAKIFQDYVNRLYALRLSDPDGALSLLCKYLLNSLYGKFGQKQEREQLVAFNNLEDMMHLIPDEGASPLIPIDEENGVYKMATESPCGFEHIGIAGMITSAARVALYRGILAVGSENVVYCDTDSVHSICKMPSEFVGQKLGAFKHEFNGEGCYCGKKLYALRNADGKEKIRAKGVSVGGRNGCRLAFDDFRRIAAGEKYIARFTQPTTARQTFGSAQPCRFTQRTRTLKRV